LEPTWGDLGKANEIVRELMPTNEQQLLTAFGAMNLVRDLQDVRNACAHISADRIQDMRNLRTRYDVTKLLHPSDAIFWIDPITKDYSWRSWVKEMKRFASLAIV